MRLLFLLFFLHCLASLEAYAVTNSTEKTLPRKKFNLKVLQESSEKDNKSYLERYKKENYPPNLVTKKNFTTWTVVSDSKGKEIQLGNYYKYQVGDKNRTFVTTIRPPSARPTRVNVIFFSSTTPRPPFENAITKPYIQLPEAATTEERPPRPTVFSAAQMSKIDEEILRKYFKFNCTLIPKNEIDDRLDPIRDEPTHKPPVKPVTKVVLTTQTPPQKPYLKKPHFPALDSLSNVPESETDEDDTDEDESDELKNFIDTDEDDEYTDEEDDDDDDDDDSEEEDLEGIAKHGHHSEDYDYDEVDKLPGVNKITGLFNTAYDFLDSAITSNEVVPIPKGHHKKKKKKHHHKKKKKKKKKKKHKKKKTVKKKHVKCKEGDHFHYYYLDKHHEDDDDDDDHSYHNYPHSYDESYEWKNIKKRDVSYETNMSKPILTTNIKVTSEYAGPTNPVTAAASTTSSETTPLQKPSTTSTSSSLEDGSYEYDLFGYDDEDSRDESVSASDESDSYEDSEYYSEEYPNDKFGPSRTNKKKKKPTKKPQRKSARQPDYDDDYDDGMFSGFFNFFDNVMGYFGYGRPKRRHRPQTVAADDYYYDDQARSTTPKNSRRPTRAITSSEHRRPRDPWYYPSYWTNSVEDEVVVLPTAVPLSPPTTKKPWITYLDPLGLFTRNDDYEPATVATEPSYGIWETSTAKDPQMMIVEAIQNISSSLVPKKEIGHVLVEHKKDYDEYQVWRLMPSSQEQINTLIEYKKNNEESNIKWWKGPSLRGHTDVVVPPGIIETFKDFLEDEEIKYETTIWNLGKAIRHENPNFSIRDKYESRVMHGHALTWNRYHRYNEMLEYMEYVQRNHPELVELIHIGSSYEGMPLIVVKIGTQELNFDGRNDNSKKMSELRMRRRKKYPKQKKKNAIFIEGGAHGEEWISPATATWLIQRVIRTIEGNETSTEAFKSIDWYILPMLNPDGYEHSHQFDRLWRKNRSKREKLEGLFSAALNWLNADDDIAKDRTTYCYGADLNRNWGDSWNAVGTSTSSCSEYYAGDSPFSEPETKALSRFLNERRKEIKIYLALHSYGQFISYPPSPSHSYIQERYDDLFDMAMVSLEALRRSGIRNKYVIDTSSDMVYQRSGSSDSYAMNQLGVPFAFTVELRGTQSMILPANQIESAALEAFHLIRGMVGYI